MNKIIYYAAEDKIVCLYRLAGILLYLHTRILFTFKGSLLVEDGALLNTVELHGCKRVNQKWASKLNGIYVVVVYAIQDHKESIMQKRKK